MKRPKRPLSKEDQEHYDFLRKHHIGREKALVMARQMTAIDKRSKKRGH